MFWNQGSLSDLSSGNSQGCTYFVAETQLQLQILSLSPMPGFSSLWFILFEVLGQVWCLLSDFSIFWLELFLGCYSVSW